jgi:catechol-2,3-dioxygenase
MDFQGISWAGLYVSNLAGMVGFYGRVLGLPVVTQGDGFCLMNAGGGSLFELWEDGLSVPGRKTPSEQSLIVGFAVQSLEPAIAELLSRGLKADSDVGCYGNSRWVYYVDPEGNRFELKETKCG